MHVLTAAASPMALLHPKGIAVDEQGYIYVADTGNHRILKVSPTGELLAVWGSPGRPAAARAGGSKSVRALVAVRNG